MSGLYIVYCLSQTDESPCGHQQELQPFTGWAKK